MKRRDEPAPATEAGGIPPEAARLEREIRERLAEAPSVAQERRYAAILGALRPGAERGAGLRAALDQPARR